MKSLVLVAVVTLLSSCSLYRTDPFKDFPPSQDKKSIVCRELQKSEVDEEPTIHSENCDYRKPESNFRKRIIKTTKEN